MRNLKLANLSDNDVSELLDLLGRINLEIDTYSHVANHLPKKIVNDLENYTQELFDEQDCRGFIT